MSIYQVAVDFPLRNSILSYEGEDISFCPGQLVEVPLGRRKVKGCILSSADSSEDKQEYKLKRILNQLDNALTLDEKELALYQWMSQYYHYSLGALIFDCMPPILKRPRKIEYVDGAGEDLPHKLNDLQQEVFSQISNSLNQGFSKHLIHGVTGSGKTLIYLNIIKNLVEQGKTVQFLLPEINLTPQFIQTFQRYLNCPVYSYHSGVSNSEKYIIWKKLKESELPCLIMGVRSSVFLPVSNLGAIIIDEEHDSSFKQSDRCPYNGRDVAIKKGQIHDVPVVLGSATPSVENYHLFHSDAPKHFLYRIDKRVSSGYFPKIEVVDIREKEEKSDTGPDIWPFHSKTIEKIQDHFDKGEQVLVFLNKLGFSNYLQCRGCGHQFQNEDCGCGLNLRFFKRKNLLSCSQCEFKQVAPNVCPKCGCMTLLQKGFGTERLEEVLKDIFPDRIIERFDRDEIKNQNDLTDKLKRFNNHEIDLFVGTQMLSKGHNFEKVNLVVILGIDSMMSFPEFRTYERAYQTVKQVAGRAGRYSKESSVLIQTLNPESTLFDILHSDDLDAFYKNELPMREVCSCPPFSRMAVFFFSSSKREKLISTINQVASSIKKLNDDNSLDLQILGPVPSGIEKRANQFSWCLMLKTNNLKNLHMTLDWFDRSYNPVSGVSVKLDVDPYQTI